MEMQSIFGSRKPNCIILDEIDGAMNSGDGKTAIAAIQEIISAPLQLKKNAAKGSGKRANQNQHPLTRPMICICNDQYASVLRPLRKVAKIFVLDTPNAQRLVSRLKFICRNEGLKTSTGALSSLSSSGGNDIRYCLNALQFHSTQSKNSITSIANGLVGQKDQSSGVYDTMDMVFYQPKSKSSSSTSAGSAFEQIEEASHSMGNYPLLINGLDENLPKMIFNDPTMNKICDAFEWMGIADAWDTRARTEQQFQFVSYIPFAALAVHKACCTGSRRRVEYPRSHFEAQKKAEKSTNILQALAENSLLHQSLRVGAGVLAVDVVPWLVATLSPNIRRLNPALQTADEKAMIQRLIELMSSLGLSFRPKYLPDGSEDYTLEPCVSILFLLSSCIKCSLTLSVLIVYASRALHELLVFRGGENDSAYRSMLPLNVKKMITREVELQQMRRSESSSSSKGGKGGATKQDTPQAASRTTDVAAFVLPELSGE